MLYRSRLETAGRNLKGVAGTEKIFLCTICTLQWKAVSTLRQFKYTIINFNYQKNYAHKQPSL